MTTRKKNKRHRLPLFQVPMEQSTKDQLVAAARKAGFQLTTEWARQILYQAAGILPGEKT